MPSWGEILNFMLVNRTHCIKVNYVKNTLRWNFHLFLALVILSYWHTTTLSVSKRSLKHNYWLNPWYSWQPRITWRLHQICHPHSQEDLLRPLHHLPPHQGQGHRRRHHHRRPRRHRRRDHPLRHWNQQGRQPRKEKELLRIYRAPIQRRTYLNYFCHFFPQFFNFRPRSLCWINEN